MVSFCVLSLLPSRFAHHRSLDPLIQRLLPPTLNDLRALLPRDLLDETLPEAQRCADLIASMPGLRVIHRWSPGYPERLRTIPYSPWCLYVLGRLPHEIDSKRPALAVVGSRRANLYGHQLLRHIFSAMQPDDCILVSGLAHGIDSAAHAAACDRGIVNVAVLAGGLDHIYPPSSVPLAERILEGGGGLISELPPGQPPFRGRFPWRNRLISGLSHGLWVVQGTRRSGSRHTVSHALAQDREIGTTPGDVFSELSETPHDLLRDGAQIILSSQDLLMLLRRGFEKIF